MFNRILPLAALLLCSLLSAQAQGLKVDSFEETMEPAAVQNKELDDAGKPCALLKITMTAQDATFQGSVKSVVNDGEYWVYMPGGATDITISAAGSAPVSYTFPQPLQGLFTYRMAVSTAAAGGGGAITETGDRITVTIPGTDVTFDMILVRVGMFEMGATKEQFSEEKDEKPVHWVRISREYYIGETEVTQALWEAVMGSNPSIFNNPDCPVENITWGDTQRFVSRLGSLIDRVVRLPSEAEWEYAARGGHKGMQYRFSGSNDPAQVAWFKDNSNNRTHPVKGLLPNELGIYDMSGNVWEMCQDYKGNYSDRQQTDPVNTKKSENRVRRGGSWDCDNAVQLRNAYRRRIVESEANRNTGFRIVIEN